jgi:hypothetical protein
MAHITAGRRIDARHIVLRMFIVIMILYPVINQSVKPTLSSPYMATPVSQGPVLTVGAILGAALLVKSLISDEVDHAADRAKEVLDHANAVADELINRIGTTYGEALDATLDQFDQETRRQFELIYNYLQQLEADLQLGVERLNETVLNDIQTVSNDMRQILSQLRDVMIVAFQGSLVLIDKAFFDALAWVAVIPFVLQRLAWDLR